MATTFKALSSVTLTSDTASISFTSIPNTYKDLLIIGSARTSTAAANIWGNLVITFNSSTSGYSGYSNQGAGNNTYSAFTELVTNNFYVFAYGSADVTSANTFGCTKIYVPQYTSANNKAVVFEWGTANANATSGANIGHATGMWSNTAAITTITIAGTGANIKTNSTFVLYGINNS